jgi:predicted amidophosphoribosyltransferase
MKKSQQLTCSRCEEPIKQRDTFCKNCGGLFSDDMLCVNHKSVKAEGVCVICSKPFCKKCGADVLKVFLCDKHSDLEITEGKVRVFGSTDNVRTQFASACLEQAGYHPFIYSRLFNPVADKVAITGIRNFGNHPIEEQKVLILFSEFINASKELKKHKFKEI